MNPDYQKLLQRVEALEKWKAQKERQQISFPLDIQSQDILRKYFMSISDLFTYIFDSGIVVSTQRFFIGKQGNFAFQVSPQTLFRYTVNVSNNEFTVQGTNFVNDEIVIFYSSDTPPDPLDSAINYYVINSTGGTFEVSLTSGGSAVNITDLGLGEQYISRAN